ncbi:hypothetical protein CHUAL_001282 [Chamberlinius hualienensis]
MANQRNRLNYLAILIIFSVLKDAWGELRPDNVYGLNAYVKGSYTLTCALYPISPDDINNIISIDWFYYSYYIEEDTVPLIEGIMKANDTIATTNLTVSDYYAGYYKCRYTLTYDVYYAVFHDYDLGSPSYYENYCSSQTYCLTLNSKCDDYMSQDGYIICNCNGEYPVPYNNDMYNPECIKAIGDNDTCTIDNQCKYLKPTEYYDCVDGECKCYEPMMFIPELAKDLCLAPAYLYESCYYDEQCLYTTPHSHCNNFYCVCDYKYGIRYMYDQQHDYCEELPFRQWYATGKMIGIGFGLAFAGMFVIGIIALIVDKFRHQK